MLHQIFAVGGGYAGKVCFTAGKGEYSMGKGWLVGKKRVKQSHIHLLGHRLQSVGNGAFYRGFV